MLEIRVVFCDTTLGIQPFLFDMKSLASCDLPTPFFPTI